MLYRIALSLGLVLFSCIQALASSTDHLAQKLDQLFPEAQGVISSALGRNLGIELREGTAGQNQLLSVFEPGAEVRHPVTDEYLGTRETFVGYLRVSRTMAEQRYLAEPFTPGMQLDRNMVVRSGNRSLRVLLVPLGAEHEDLMADLELSLARAGFEIINLLRFEKVRMEIGADRITRDNLPLIAKRLKADAVLNVEPRDAQGGTQLDYQFIDARSFRSFDEGSVKLRPFYSDATAMSDTLDTQGSDGALIGGAWQTQRTDHSWRLMQILPGSRLLLGGDGRLALARIAGSSIEILTEHSLPPGRLYSLSAADTNGDAVTEVYASIRSDDRLFTARFDLTQGEFQRRDTHFDWIVYRMPVDRGWQMLAQRVPLGQWFGGRLGTFRLINDQIEIQDELPLEDFEIVGSARIGEQYYRHVADGHLGWFDLQGQLLGTSETDYGAFTRALHLSDAEGELERLYMKRRVLPIGDISPHSLVVATNRPFLEMASAVSAFRSSRISVLEPRNGSAPLARFRSVEIDKAVVSDLQRGDLNDDGNEELVVLMVYRNYLGAPTAGSALLFFQIGDQLQAPRRTYNE